jgi:hypothetical protein
MEDYFYNEVVEYNTTDTYLEYLKKYPKGKYRRNVHSRVELLYWEQAEINNSLDLVKKYIKKYPKGKFIRKAKKLYKKFLKDEKYWRGAVSTNIYYPYIYKFPEGKYIKEAKSMSNKIKLKNDVVLYSKVTPNGQRVSSGVVVTMLNRSIVAANIYSHTYGYQECSVWSCKTVESTDVGLGPSEGIEVELNGINGHINYSDLNVIKLINDTVIPKEEFDYQASVEFKRVIRRFGKSKKLSIIDAFEEKYRQSNIINKAYDLAWKTTKKKNIVKWYQSFINKLDYNEYTHDAKKRLFYLPLKRKNAKSLYLTAGKFERNKKFYDAKRVYDYLLEKYSDSQYAVKANDKLVGISRMEEYQSAQKEATYQQERSLQQAQENSKNRNHQSCKNRRNSCYAQCQQASDSGAYSDRDRCKSKCGKISCY